MSETALLLALLPIGLLALGFIAYCLYDLSRHQVRWLPKWAWALLIIASVPLGGIVYLAGGRLER